MFENPEKKLVFEYARTVLNVQLGNTTKQDALAFFLTCSKRKSNTDISYASMINSVQSIIGNDKSSAAIAIEIFENIIQSGKAGMETRQMMRKVLPTLNLPVYVAERVQNLMKELRIRNSTIVDYIRPNNNQLNTKYGVSRACRGAELNTKYGVSRPRSNNQVSTKYGVGKCFPGNDFTK